MRTESLIAIWPEVERLCSSASALKKVKSAYRHREVFLTMPPFRNFWVIGLPGVHTIVDWRDGWSIAMVSGYGGTSPQKRFKSMLAKVAELATIAIADEIWTCTPGLLRYHRKWLPSFLQRKLKLVPNGHQTQIIQERFGPFSTNKRMLTAICTGKFSVYGEEKVYRIIDTLALRYPNARILIRVVGSQDEDLDPFRSYISRLAYDIVIRQEGRKTYSEVIDDISQADLAVAVIRDQAYDFGTKIFDYIAAGTPVLDVFDDFIIRDYFSGCFDTDYDPEVSIRKAHAFHRDAQVAVLAGTPEPLGSKSAGKGTQS